MKNFLNKIFNFGIQSDTNYWVSRRISLTNKAILIVSFFILVQSTFSFFSELPLYILLFQIVFFLISLLSLYFIYLNKTITGRILFFIVCNIAIIGTSILTGSQLHYQYFIISILGVPFLFFKDEIGKIRLLLTPLSIAVFVFLEIYHMYFEPIMIINPAYVSNLSLINDVLSITIGFAIFYLIYRENNIYVKELKLQSLVLEDKNTQLEHFAFIAAHDLNEPLRTVTSFIDIVKEEYEEQDEDLKTYFSFITNAVERMRTMIDGLLNYSRIGKSANRENINISKLITEIQADLSGVIKEKEVKIRFKKLPSINCIQIEIRQLFQNLITNAIKFQKPGVAPNIEISCVENKNHWEFCVSDNGIGIAPKNLKTIFQFFTKLHLKTEYKGQGIGLAFCKKIVEIHNGKIWVTSNQKRGSQFYFTIQRT